MGLHVLDAARLDRLVEMVAGGDPLTIAAQIIPDVAHLLIARSTFAHAALLVFPDDYRDLLSALADRGFHCSSTVPSTIVRDRLGQAAVQERVLESESHLAFATEPTTARIDELCDVLLGDGMVRDGGGFNPHENTSTLYFRRPAPLGYLYRIELLCSGWHPDTLAAHLGGLPVPTAAETS